MDKTLSLFRRFQDIRERRDSGVLRLCQDSNRIDIHFSDGRIKAVSSNLRKHRLGQYLVIKGSVKASMVEKLLGRSHLQGIALGEVALRRGLVEKSKLRQLIRQQARDLLGLCMEDGFGIDLFQSESSLRECSIHTNLDAVLLDLARKVSLTADPESSRRFTVKETDTLSSFPWAPEEISVLSQLGQTQTLSGLQSVLDLPVPQLENILRTIHTLGYLEFLEDESQGTTALVKSEAIPLELLVPEIHNPHWIGELEVAAKEESFVSEQFAALKVQIGGAQSEKPLQVVCVSSGHVQDGKSLISCNLALSFCRDLGRKVVLLDCDFRNPTLQSHLGISLSPGILNYLGGKGLEPYCYMRRVGQLYVMTAGGTARNPVELLAQPKMQQLIDDLRKDFDTIIVDSPPLQPISDTQIVSRFVDGLILVIRQGKTPYRAVQKALDSLDQSKLLGVVFNDVKSQAFHTYYDYRYYSYGNDDHYPYRTNEELEVEIQVEK